MIRSLADLLHPHDPARVEAAMLENRRLHLATDRARAYARLLPWAAFNALPTAELLAQSRLQVLQRGRDALFDMAAPRGKPGSHRALSPEALHALCEQGMSLLLNKVDQLVPAIAALSVMIERRFGVAVVANCYASFHKASALPPHYDDHHVLVLQLHGRKRWFFHGQPYRAPLNSHVPPPADPGPVEAELVMEPGDALLIPRGEVHWAEVAGPNSLHLSIGIQPPRGSDVLRWLAARAEREEDGREDVNPLAGPERQAAQQARLRQLFVTLAETLDIGAFHAATDARRDRAHPLNLGLLQELRGDTVVLPALRRRAVPDGLTPGEREILAWLLEHDAATIDALAAALPAMASDAVRAAVAALARKSLLFLFAGD